MAVERTLSIVKPDAVANNVIGQIWSRFEGSGLKIVAAMVLHLTPEQAGGFYAGWITSDLVGPFKGDPGASGWGGDATLPGPVARATARFSVPRELDVAKPLDGPAR